MLLDRGTKSIFNGADGVWGIEQYDIDFELLS